ncbi:hypothetical protein [Mixta calida]|uniref:hypothetical protein n=1 Tax=Mixta calida TaxID=665913 RepID=UPI0028AA9DF4|nr:hypothetical protein [Mixta calida]
MMLENYYPENLGSTPVTDEQRQRLEVVKAALEIAKASVGGADAATQAKTEFELRQVAAEIGLLANAIQAAIEQK